MAKYEVIIGLTIEDGMCGWAGAACVRDKVKELANSGALRHTLSAGHAEIAYVESRDAEESATSQRAENEAQKRYQDDIRGVGDEFMAMAKDGDFDDDDEANTWLHESIDGHGRVIYTAKAQECLCLSSNDDAHIEEFGSEGIVSDDGIQWSVLAFSAFSADIREYLDAHDVDPSDPDTWGMETETEIDPDEDAYTFHDLFDLETLSTGQTCNLKMENSKHRVWLCRCGVADGMPYDDQITVEELKDGRWVEVCKYAG